VESKPAVFDQVDGDVVPAMQPDVTHGWLLPHATGATDMIDASRFEDCM
jgi:hypothetical protein